MTEHLLNYPSQPSAEWQVFMEEAKREIWLQQRVASNSKTQAICGHFIGRQRPGATECQKYNSIKEKPDALLEVPMALQSC